MEDYEFRDYVDLNYVVFNVAIDDASDLITFGDFKKFLQPVRTLSILFNQITYTDGAAKLILQLYRWQRCHFTQLQPLSLIQEGVALHRYESGMWSC